MNYHIVHCDDSAKVLVSVLVASAVTTALVGCAGEPVPVEIISIEATVGSDTTGLASETGAVATSWVTFAHVALALSFAGLVAMAFFRPIAVEGRLRYDYAAMCLMLGVMVFAFIDIYGHAVPDSARGLLLLLCCLIALLLLPFPWVRLGVGAENAYAWVLAKLTLREVPAPKDWFDSELTKQLEFYLEVEAARLKLVASEKPTNDGNGGKEPPPFMKLAAVSEKLYEELTAIDRKIAFTLGLSAAVAAIHGFLIRGIAVAEGGTTDLANGDVAMIIATVGLILAIAAALIAISPKAFWLGDEYLRRTELEEDSAVNAVLRGLIRERRLRDKCYTAAKRLIYFSTIALLMSHLLAWFQL